MNTNKARVADVTAKTQSDILQDSLVKTDFEFQDAEVVTDVIRSQPQVSATDTSARAAVAAQSANFDLAVANFNQTILAQNNRILQLQEYITQSQQTIKVLNDSLTLVAEDVRRLSQSQGGSAYSAITAVSRSHGTAMKIALR